MNTLRLIAIALPVMMLMACGGGGGGGGTVTTAPTTGGPNMPPTGGGGETVDLSNLVNFELSTGHATIQAISDITASRNVNLLTSSVAESENFGSETNTTCTSNFNFCSARVLPGDGTQTITFAINSATTVNPVNDISLIRQNGYFKNSNYDSTTTSGVTVNGVTLARGNLTGTRITGSAPNLVETPLEIQSFAGWLDGSVFGTTQIEVGESGSEQYRFVSYLVGVPSGSNPSSTGSETSATWEGAAVGSIKADRTFILGEATVTVPTLGGSQVDVMLDNWRNLNNEAVSVDVPEFIIPITGTDGTFNRDTNLYQVEGRFYGTGHTEVGGFFNTPTVTGAFGGTRQ